MAVKLGNKSYKAVNFATSKTGTSKNYYVVDFYDNATELTQRWVAEYRYTTGSPAVATEWSHCTFTCTRDSSPYKSATTGTITDNADIFYGDTLSFSITPDTGFSAGVTSPGPHTVTSNVTGATISGAWVTRNNYTLSWDWDSGSTSSTTYTKAGSIPYDASITYPANDTMSKTGYTFSGWDVAITNMPAYDQMVKALWTINQYTITFDSNGGSAVSPITQDYNTTITAPTEPTKTGYDFQKWDNDPLPSKMPAHDVTCTAQWVKHNYTIKWKNGTTTLETDSVPYLDIPTYDGATPTKAKTAQYTYTFSGWSPTVVAATANATYSAQFDSTVNTYTITWKNGDDTLETDTDVPYGDTPTYDGDTPTKTGYHFIGWDPEIADVTGDQTYSAVFEINTYTITWKNGTTTLETDTDVEYGSTPSYDGETPTKASTAAFTYTFSGWTPAVAEVTQDQTYSAKFTAIGRSYKVSAAYDTDSLKGLYLSTDENATSGKDSGSYFNYNSTVYVFVTLNAGAYHKDGWVLISGTADKEEAVYRVDSHKITGTYNFGTISANRYVYAATFINKTAIPITVRGTGDIISAFGGSVTYNYYYGEDGGTIYFDTSIGSSGHVYLNWMYEDKTYELTIGNQVHSLSQPYAFTRTYAAYWTASGDMGATGAQISRYSSWSIAAGRNCLNAEISNPSSNQCMVSAMGMAGKSAGFTVYYHYTSTDIIATRT